MGYIKKLKNNELVGGTDKTTIYPVTSTEAVFEEVSDKEFKSQKYLNNHITNERIVDNTIENQKLKDDTIDMGKLNTRLKTTIQNAYDASWKVKEEPFSLETKYDANDVVYDPATNSSYVSLTADNQGNPVNPEDEGYVEGKWRIIINGISAVQATEEIEETKNELIDYIQENLKDQVDDEIADAESRIAASEQYAQGVIAEAEETARSISGIVYQTVAAAPNYTDTIPVQNKAITAQIGYFTCSGGSGATITVDDTDAATFTPVKGGQVKILMAQKSTVTSGNVQLQFGSVEATKKVLLYNKEAVSASNTWEEGEIISVYFDGTNYQASNAQGGGGKAEKIKYNNSRSVLSANNVQDALTEVGSMFKNETVSSFAVINGTNLTTYTNRRLDVKRGFVEIEIDGSVSKASGLADDREYLRIQLYDNSDNLVKTILSVSTTNMSTTAERAIAESNLTHLLIGTEIQSDGYIIVGERSSSASYYELSVKNQDSTSNLVSIGNVSVSGTDSSTYVDSAPLSVSAGDNLRAVIDGNISKATSLNSNQAYLRVRFTGISGTVIDLYNACTTVPSSSPNDYAPTITRKVIDFTPAEDGTVIFQNRMSNDSSFTAKLLVDADSKFNKTEKTFNDKFEKTLVINKDAVLRRGGTKGRALLNLGRIYGHVAWDITLGNNNYQYVVRLYSYDVGYYYPSGPNYDSGWLTGHSVGEVSDESYQYFLLAVGRVDNQVLTDEDLAAIQSALSGSIAYNNLSHLAKELQKKNIISNRHLQVCAHRGFHLNDVPENSIDSVRFAAMMGFDMVETDFSQTSDGELVLMHDDSINRTMVNADGTAISGTVKMINKTLAELRSNYVLNSEDARMVKPIPTLEEYFLACKKYGIFPLPEIKTWGNSNAAVLKAYEMGCEIMGKDNFAFISFGYDYLDYARTLSPTLLLGYIGESILDTVNTITGESRETPYTMWSPKYDNTHGVSAELIKQYHEKGMKVQVWTPPVADYPYINELGADIVTTNDIGPNIGNTIGYVFDSYATWNDFITDGVFDGQTLTLDTSQQLSCNLKETIVNGKFALEINFTGSITITAPNLSTTVTSSDADETHIYQGVIDYKNPSLSITATAASVIKMIRYYVVPVNQ